MSFPELSPASRFRRSAAAHADWATEGDVAAVGENLWAGRAGTRLKQTAMAGIVLLALLNAADAVTTQLVLAATPAGATEANPLAQVLISGGTPRLLLTKMAIIALLGMSILRRRPRLGITVGVWLACGLYVAAVLSNVLILRML